MLELLVEERAEDAKLVHIPENVINLEDALACVTQHPGVRDSVREAAPKQNTKSHQYHVKGKIYIK